MTTAKKTSNLVTESFEGLPVVFREDGWINMTKVIKHFPGKRLEDLYKLTSFQEYCVALMEALPQTREISGLLQARRGGKPGNAGSWCHPKLAVFFARWLDVRFAVWCDLMIDNILKGHLQVEVVVPTLEAQKLKGELEELQRAYLRLELDKRGLEDRVKELEENGLKSGEIPKGWLTCWTFLEDRGHGLPFIRAAVKDFGSLAASACKRSEEGYSPVVRHGKQGTKASDYTYYPPSVLEIAYAKLLELYEMAA